MLEVDAKLTKDGIPVAIHDATLDRTTTCTGEVRTYTLAALRPASPTCSAAPAAACAPQTVKPQRAIATIAEVLELARLTGAKVNLEIKNVPTDPDYDPTPGYANRVMDVVRRRACRARSSHPELLAREPRRGQAAHARVITSLLTLAPTRTSSSWPHDKGYRWLSPQWPLAAGFVAAAHRAGPGRSRSPSTSAPTSAPPEGQGRRLITDDPWMAAGALGRRPVKA